MNTNKIMAAFLACVSFWLIGIVINSIIIRELFDTDPTQQTLWSPAGFVYAIIAGATGILSLKIYKKISKEN